MSGVISLDQLSRVVQNTLGKKIDCIRIVQVSSLLSSKLSFSNTTKELVLGETSPTFRVVVGQLKNTVSLQTFNLEFDDGTACINAYVCSSFSCYNFSRKIIVVKWNLIQSNDKDNYLEILEVVPVENDCVAELNGLKCSAAFSVNDACFLLHNRNFIDKDNLNVVGQLSAVSEVIRLKKTFLFILELRDGATNRTVHVLVREPRQLHWQRILVPDRDYLLTGLKPTTLYSGEPSERKLFVCTSPSQLFPISTENDDITLNVINIEEYLESSGVPDAVTVYSKWFEANKVEPQNCQFVTYQGVVSNCDRAADGVFELDSKIRLYVTHISSSTGFCQMRVGTRVAVFNSHLCGHSEPPKIHLFCCSRACVKVISFAKSIPSDVPLSTRQTVTASRDVSTVSRLVTDFCLRVDELNAFLDASLKLAAKYGSSSCTDELARLALCGTAGVGLGTPQNRSHNALANFYATEHELCRKTPTKLFTVPTIADVQAHCQAAVAGDDSTTDPAGPGCQWRLKVIASSELLPPWVLIGTLRTSRKTGNLQLVDRTGAIDCVIASRPSSSLPNVTVSRQQHWCTTSCCNSASDGCPYAQTWSLNVCYRIDHFQLVVETFPHPDGQSVDRSYIQFSMLDALKLCDMLAPPNQQQSRVKPTQGDAEPGLSSSKVQNPSKRSRVDSSETSASVDDASRHSQKTIENSAICGVSLRRVETSTVQTCKCSVSQIFVVENCEIASLRSRIPMQMSLSLTAVGFFIAAPRVFSTACSICPLSETPSVAVGIPPVRRVCTIFQGRSLCSAGVLHAGCVYRLSRLGSRDLTTFTGKVGLKRTTQAELEKKASTRMILLDCELDVARLVQPFDSNGCEPELRSLLSADVVVAIGNILGDVRVAIDSRPSIWTNSDMDDSLSCCPLALVSFTGLIVSRSHCASQQQYKSATEWKINPEMEHLSVSVPQNLTVVLIVRDIRSPAESAIYMCLDGMLYPLGLLPGATVRFDRLQSKTSSRDRRYCQFSISSSCRVASFAPTMSDNATLGRYAGSHATELPATRCVIYLAELWRNSVTDDVFCVAGRVTMVLRVSLSVDGTRTGAQFMSSASFLIDDGSSTAFVSCSGRQVAELLDLNVDQWSGVEDWVRRAGNIYYTLQSRRDNIGAAAALANVDGRTARNGGSAVLLECFLRELCDSCAVKRTVTVHARRFRTVLNGHGQKCANINGWLLADFERRSIRKGNVSFESAVLPSLQLECVALVTT